MYVRLDPCDVFRAHYTLSAAQTTWSPTREVLAHAQANVIHMLHQLQKMTLTQAELSGYKWSTKGFLGALLGAVGTLFNIGMNTANSVNLATIMRYVGEIQAEMPEIR